MFALLKTRGGRITDTSLPECDKSKTSSWVSQAYVDGTIYTLSSTELILLIDHHDLNALEGVDLRSPLLSCFLAKYLI